MFKILFGETNFFGKILNSFLKIPKFICKNFELFSENKLKIFLEKNILLKEFQKTKIICLIYGVGEFFENSKS